jgi:hypothetical protein
MKTSTYSRRLLAGAAFGLFGAVALTSVPTRASADPVYAEGDYAIGINSILADGDNVTTGDTTTVSGYFSRGVNTLAENGNNVTNTGTVTATGDWSRAVIAQSYSYTGTNTVNVTGNVSADFHGIVALGFGDSIVNVGTGYSVASTGVSPGGIAILNIANGTATTNIDGTVTASARDVRGLDVRSASSFTTIGDTGSLFGTFDGTEGADSFALSSGGQWSTAGTSDFGGGSDTLTNAGLIIAGDGTTFSNLTVFHNSGTLALEAGTFALPQSTDFTNSGTIALVGGATTITSAAPLVNDGVINLQNGSDADILTITNGFTATGNSALWVDASDTSNDKLVILGAVTGVTQISVIGTGAPTATVSQIVTADSADPGAFVIVDNSANSMTSYGLRQSGGNFYLYAAPSAIALQPLAVANVTQDMWHQSADILSAYMESRGTDGAGGRTNGLGVWGQAYVSSDRYGGRDTQTVFGGAVDVDNRVKTDRQGLQAGIDFRPSDGQFIVGVMGGYQKAKADTRSSNGGIRAHGYNVGAYAHVGDATGLYGNVLVKADWNNVRLPNSAFDTADGRPNSRSIGAEGEVGMRWERGSTSFDVGGQLAYVRTTIDGFSAQAIDYDFGHSDSVRGRLNAEATFGGRLAPFVSAKLFHEFDGSSKLRLTSGTEFDHVDGEGRGTWARLEGGVGAKKGPGPLVAAWAEVGDVRGLGLRAGYRF